MRYYAAQAGNVVVLRGSPTHHYTHAIVLLWLRPRFFVRSVFCTSAPGEAEIAPLLQRYDDVERHWVVACKQIPRADYLALRDQCDGTGRNNWIRTRSSALLERVPDAAALRAQRAPRGRQAASHASL